MLQYIIDHMDHDFTVTQSFIPENLHFTLNDEDESTIEYEISASAKDLSGDPVITGNDFISPENTHWRLRYGASINIAAGVHTSVKMSYGGNFMSVSGSDWMWYFNHRFMPFDGRPTHTFDYTLMSPTMAGVNYEAISTDVADLLTAILDMVLGRTDSLPITYSLSATSLVWDYFRLDLADTTSILDIVKNICAYSPGRAFEITPARVFQISGTDIRWYGDPDSIANDPLNFNLIWTINGDYPPLSLDFTNTGPRETHLQGEGDGTTVRNVVTLGNVANQDVYWRTDRQEQFTNAITRDAVEARTHEQLAFDLNPVHEIPISLDPDIVDQQYDILNSNPPGTSTGFFWENFKPGRAIWVDLQLLAHHIDSAHHIVSMDCTVNANGACKVDITENQIYDTSGQAHVDEG